MNSVWTAPGSSAEDLMLQDHQELSLDHPELPPDDPEQYNLLSVDAHPGKTELKPRMSKEEVEVLEKVFQENPKPSASFKAQLADRLGLERQRINSWFQNRRAKAKQERKQGEHQAQKAVNIAASGIGFLDEVTSRISESSDQNAHQHLKPLSTSLSSVAQLEAPTSPHNTSQEGDSERGRTARRNILTTELTESLRQQLLWERQQKASTQNDHQHRTNKNINVQECVKKQEKPLSRVSTSIYSTPSVGHDRGGETPRHQFSWIESVVWKLNEFRNTLSDRMQPRVAPGHVRVSWTCRCGKRLYIEVPKHRQAAGIAFAQQASGSSNVDSVAYRSSDIDDSSSTSSSTKTFERGNLSQSSAPSLDSPLTAPSISSDTAPDPFIPAGTRKYLLLCVNTGTRQIKLANVDVTDVVNDEEVFKKMQAEYRNLRGRRRSNPLIKPKMMHYIKFQLIYLQKSKECIGNYEVNSIPSRTEIYRQEYAFSPCPPMLGDLPIPPPLFMHAFLDPGDHMGSMAVEMLPKKLNKGLSWDGSLNHPSNVPVGWGFYIIEGLDWLCVTWCVVITTLAVTLFTIFWSALMQDVQGGTGIGQYCIAILAVMVSAALLATEGLRGPP